MVRPVAVMAGANRDIVWGVQRRSVRQLVANGGNWPTLSPSYHTGALEPV
jgi:hypothetical protein